ncbi:hypothetical protein L596_026171 [Steinernema carpocapsae]|uniref:G-protein coupled receptors family 1 profile domain-containing protein n=1 Tax=Steinernema carpocapsae TaxID=34508 RepID=A0A4U5M0L9_STECR|nr:hypothetical protein L596_026171 [Steinernema carpocapsae]
MSSMDYKKLCKDGLHLSQDSIFVAVMGCKTFCSLVGLCLIALITYFEQLTKSFHKNARLIIFLHFGMVFISATGSALSDGFDFLRFTALKAANHDTDCPVAPFPATIGTTFKLIKIFGTAGIIGTVFAWGLERFIATVYAKSYEGNGCRLGILMCAIATALAIFDVSLHLSKVDFSLYLSMVSVTKPAIDLSMKCYYVLAAIEVFGVVLLGLIWIMNVRFNNIKKRVFSSLSYKSQIQENIEAVALMFPVAFLHFTFGVTAALVVPSITLNVDEERDKTKFIAALDTIVVYYVVLPVALFWRSLVKRRNSKRVLNLSVHRESGDHHFTMLHKLFN